MVRRAALLLLLCGAATMCAADLNLNLQYLSNNSSGANSSGGDSPAETTTTAAAATTTAAAATTTTAAQPRPGGSSDTDVTDEAVLAAAACAVTGLNSREEASAPQLQLVDVLSATKQVVAGVLYRLRVRAAGSSACTAGSSMPAGSHDCPADFPARTWDTTVLVQAWAGVCELQDAAEVEVEPQGAHGDKPHHHKHGKDDHDGVIGYYSCVVADRREYCRRANAAVVNRTCNSSAYDRDAACCQALTAYESRLDLRWYTWVAGLTISALFLVGFAAMVARRRRMTRMYAQQRPVPLPQFDYGKAAPPAYAAHTAAPPAYFDNPAYGASSGKVAHGASDC